MAFEYRGRAFHTRQEAATQEARERVVDWCRYASHSGIDRRRLHAIICHPEATARAMALEDGELQHATASDLELAAREQDALYQKRNLRVPETVLIEGQFRCNPTILLNVCKALGLRVQDLSEEALVSQETIKMWRSTALSRRTPPAYFLLVLRYLVAKRGLDWREASQKGRAEPGLSAENTLTSQREEK